MTQLSVTFVEIEVDRCSLVYGVAPCTAALGTTGVTKCYNTFATCQDPTNYDPATETLRFAVASDHLSQIDQGSLPAIPSVISVDHTPGRIRIAEDLGERATVRVSFVDHPDADISSDPYLGDPSRPALQGTFWGRFRARQQYLLGRSLRWIEGTVGESIASMETRHYIIESIEGPDMSGRVVIVAKDALKLADGDRAQAPRISTGQLLAGISNVAVTATLKPTGIGNFEYPASGKVAIGDEVLGFTRVGDTLTLTRGQSSTTAEAHDADDRVQLVLEYAPQKAGLIITDLIETYASVPVGLIDVQSDNPANFAGQIARPTSVRQLVGELMQQASVTIYFDEIENRIVYRDLRAVVSAEVTLTDDIVLADSFSWEDEPTRRVSQVWTYYGQRNPLERLDEEKNFSVVSVDIDSSSQSPNEYGRPAILQIFSRWIAKDNTPAAADLGDVILTRFRNVPRLFRFAIQPDAVQPKLGATVAISMPVIQSETGAPATVPVSVVSRRDRWAAYDYEAEEFRLQARDPAAPVLFTLTPPEVDQPNVNLRSVFDASGLIATASTVAVFTVPTSVTIGGRQKAPTISTGSWPTGADLTLRVNGSVIGLGGDGGAGDGVDPSVVAGESGQTALLATFDIAVENEGLIAGGGGGGGGGGFEFDLATFGGGGGGGGRGTQPGVGGFPGVGDLELDGEPGQPGTTAAPGAGGAGAGLAGSGGAGGDLGTAGANGDTVDSPGGSGGSGGAGIVGASFVTLTGAGTIIGGTI